MAISTTQRCHSRNPALDAGASGILLKAKKDSGQDIMTIRKIAQPGYVDVLSFPLVENPSARKGKDSGQDIMTSMRVLSVKGKVRVQRKA